MLCAYDTMVKNTGKRNPWLYGIYTVLGWKKKDTKCGQQINYCNLEMYEWFKIVEKSKDIGNAVNQKDGYNFIKVDRVKTLIKIPEGCVGAIHMVICR